MSATQSNAVAIMSRFRIGQRRNRMTDALFWREMTVSVSAPNRIQTHISNRRTYIRLAHADSCGQMSPLELHVFAMVHSFAAKCYYMLLSHLAFSMLRQPHEFALTTKTRIIFSHFWKAGSHNFGVGEIKSNFDAIKVLKSSMRTAKKWRNARQNLLLHNLSYQNSIAYQFRRTCQFYHL